MENDNNKKGLETVQAYVKKNDLNLDSSILVKVFESEIRTSLEKNKVPYIGTDDYKFKVEPHERDDIVAYLHIKDSFTPLTQKEIRTGEKPASYVEKDRYGDYQEIQYSYKNGFFSTFRSTTLYGENRKGLEAYLATKSNSDGSKTLHIALNGENSHFLENRDFTEWSTHLNPLIKEIQKYRENNPDVTKVAITGHHDGAALAKELFIKIGKDDENVKALIFGDTGSVMRKEHVVKNKDYFQEVEDSGITNYKNMMDNISEERGYKVSNIIPSSVKNKIEETIGNKKLSDAIYEHLVEGPVNTVSDKAFSSIPIVGQVKEGFDKVQTVAHLAEIGVIEHGVRYNDKALIMSFDKFYNLIDGTGNNLIKVNNKSEGYFNSRVSSVELRGDLTVAKSLITQQQKQPSGYLNSYENEFINKGENDPEKPIPALINKIKTSLHSSFNKYTSFTTEIDENKFSSSIYSYSFRKNHEDLIKINGFNENDFENYKKLKSVELKADELINNKIGNRKGLNEVFMQGFNNLDNKLDFLNLNFNENKLNEDKKNIFNMRKPF